MDYTLEINPLGSLKLLRVLCIVGPSSNRRSTEWHVRNFNVSSVQTNVTVDEMNNGLEDGNPSRTCDSKEGKSASKRFGEVSDEELIKYYEGNQSSSTRKNTRWGLKVFQGMLYVSVLLTVALSIHSVIMYHGFYRIVSCHWIIRLTCTDTTQSVGLIFMPPPLLLWKKGGILLCTCRSISRPSHALLDRHQTWDTDTS